MSNLFISNISNQNVYVIKRKYSYSLGGYHTVMFKSKIIYIDFEKEYFCLESVYSYGKNLYKFNFNDSFNRDNIENSFISYDYTILPINEVNSLYYTNFKKNFVKLQDKITQSLLQLEIKFNSDTTKNLMYVLRTFHANGLRSTYDNKVYKLVKKILNTREHFPNKKESKVIRRLKSQGRYNS